METFEICQAVNDLLSENRDAEARDRLVQLLDELRRANQPYPPVVNALIRSAGLYPYIQSQSASWEDRFAYEAFKVDVGLAEPATLHREQSALLKRLLEGENLAVSAPTSFGKSFIIDAFISINQPRNVVIIVPTLALTDETRRRLQRKFSREYKVITTSGVELGAKNILVFPQERAAGYVDQLDSIDLLVIDEFYKASPAFDKERSPSLLRAILALGKKARQRYFLAPNIADLKGSLFTAGMEFARLDFNTVYLEKHNLFEEIQGDIVRKSEALVGILADFAGKSLIYAGTYSGISSVANLIIDRSPPVDSRRLNDFAHWLETNYDPTWQLTTLIKRGSGIHNGQLHRALAQIQVRLFEEDDGLKNLISTSSIIEGVNTSAENVIIWSNKNGKPRLDDFTYKNIIGRGGRMFKHFVGRIFILEIPPPPTESQLNLSMPDELLGGLDEREYAQDLTREQIAKILQYKDEMRGLLGQEAFHRIERLDLFQSSDCYHILRIARDLVQNPGQWSALAWLNSNNVEYWDTALYRIIQLHRTGWDAPYGKVVAFIKVLAGNWKLSIPQMLKQLEPHDIGIDLFFTLERNVTYKMAALLNDLQVLRKELFGRQAVDISPFIARVSHAFLPPLVYQLEEYGLPRMISKKIHNAGLLDLTDVNASLHETIGRLSTIGMNRIVDSARSFDSFDVYMLEHFFEGITPNT